MCFLVEVLPNEPVTATMRGRTLIEFAPAASTCRLAAELGFSTGREDGEGRSTTKGNVTATATSRRGEGRITAIASTAAKHGEERVHYEVIRGVTAESSAQSRGGPGSVGRVATAPRRPGHTSNTGLEDVLTTATASRRHRRTRLAVHRPVPSRLEAGDTRPGEAVALAFARQAASARDTTRQRCTARSTTMNADEVQCVAPAARQRTARGRDHVRWVNGRSWSAARRPASSAGGGDGRLPPLSDGRARGVATPHEGGRALDRRSSSSYDSATTFIEDRTHDRRRMAGSRPSRTSGASPPCGRRREAMAMQ